MLLRLDNVDTYYGQIHILQNVTLEVQEGELVCLLGGNASGKSTTLKTIIGMVRPRRGAVRFNGEEVNQRPTSYRIGKGMAIVPENRRLFGPMTVLENLEMGAYLHDGGKKEDFDRVYAAPETSQVWRPAPGDPGPARLFGQSVYQRGAMTLQALRVAVGDTAFFAILRGWAAAHRFGTGSTAQFQALAGDVAGRSLAGLFRTWLYSESKPAHP